MSTSYLTTSLYIISSGKSHHIDIDQQDFLPVSSCEVCCLSAILHKRKPLYARFETIFSLFIFWVYPRFLHFFQLLAPIRAPTLLLPSVIRGKIYYLSVGRSTSLFTFCRQPLLSNIPLRRRGIILSQFEIKHFLIIQNHPINRK